MIIGLSGSSIEPSILKNFDGISVYTNFIYENLLQQKGIDVTSFAFGAKNQRLKYSYNISGNYIGSVLKGFLGRRYSLPCDLMHFTDHKIIPIREPSIATIHDAVPISHPEWVSGRFRFLKNTILRTTVKYADHYIAVSNYAVAELEEYFKLPSDRIHVVHNGIDDRWLEILKPDPNFLQRYRIQKDYFLFVGTFQPRKNLERLIRAYMSLPKSVKDKHQLVLVGRSGWGNEEILNLISRASKYFPTRIIWFDNVREFNELRQFYLHAYSFTFPSLHEGFGIPVLEAFASSLPVICSNLGSIPEIAGNAALYFDPYQEDEISSSMLEVSEMSNSNRLDLIKKGFERLEYFKKNIIMKQLLNAYSITIGEEL